MTTTPEQEIEGLRTRLTGLSEACLRINESLDLENVLCEVLHSACALTGAQYGVIATLDKGGGLEYFRTAGLTSAEIQDLENPDGIAFVEHISQFQEPLRVPDFAGLVRSLDLSHLSAPVAVRSFLTAPIRHQGEGVGNIFLGTASGTRDFTRADEETLVMFASQAALVIANARRYREEQRARTDLETLIDTSPVGVMVLDVKTATLVSANLEARRILEDFRPHGGVLEDFSGEITFQGTDGQVYTVDVSNLAATLRRWERVRGEEIVLQVPDHPAVTVLVNATSIFGPDGALESLIVILQDMSAVQELERLRAELLGMVSHELRTPLTSIKGSAATLLADAATLDPAEMRQFFRIIDEQADRMREMINDLLDVARIRTGTLLVDPAPVELIRLVDEARTTFLGADYQQTLYIDLAPDLPRVMADRRRVLQVLNNLLANAARYSPRDSTVSVTAHLEEVHLALTIRDEGRGVAACRLPHLFRQFAQGESPDAERLIGGMGLGLAICKGIVEAHGGRIWAESEGERLGSRFTFTLPLFVPAAKPVASPPAPRPRPDAPPCILAVDDDPQILRYVRDILTKAGYRPVVTGEPETVEALLKVHRPDLVLLDLLLPGTDGLTLMERLPLMAEVPVVFLSGYGREQLMARAFSLGAVDYIVKPFAPTELLARVQAALHRGRYAEVPPAYRWRDLQIDFASRTVTFDRQEVTLTATEYHLLCELALQAGRVVTHEQLLQQVWGRGRPRDPRRIRAIIKKLRRKLRDDAQAPTYIQTVRRVGYRMARGQALEEPPAT